MADIIEQKGASYKYDAAGTNTLVQVSKDPVTLYRIDIYNAGGSVGFLQFYDNGTAEASAGTPDFAFPVNSGTAAAGTPSLMSYRDIDLGPTGIALKGGLSYLWAVGGTGTVAHGVNANLFLSYKGTAL